MKRHLMWVFLTALMAGGLAGCGKQEIEALKGKVATLERELADSGARLDAKDKELAGVQDLVKAKEEELNKLRVERDKCKQELAAAKKKTAPPKKK
jgi:septal ring factor EnvC (AmiA/AmiB activator)